MAGQDGNIAVDGTQLTGHAAEVHRIGAEIEGQLATLKRKVVELGASGWKGIGATSAAEAADKLDQAGRMVSQAINDHGKQVTAANQFYQQGEDEVRRMFNKS
ncbi:MAG TPA: WXG100 family type VII secretion target [Mycobacteriales bacterium]|nr:WXG100 family type VII secretion target [Mycobacteriales bacterium]